MTMVLTHFDKLTYLQDKHVASFCDYLLNIIIGNKPFTCKLKKVKREEYLLYSFSDGIKGYYWAGASYQSTQTTLIKLHNELHRAVQNNDEKAALLACLAILDWGQVYRECVNWLVSMAHQNEVVSTLTKATKLIDGTLEVESKIFQSLFQRGGDLRCNSGTTKIFALLSTKSIIYDGRVACALGMIVLDYMAEKNLKSIPEKLLFLMDADSKRNPSNGHLTFPSKSNMKDKLLNQAISNVRINLILQKIENDVISSGVFSELNIDKSETLRAIESVLFMAGYKVHKDHFIKNSRYFSAN